MSRCALNLCICCLLCAVSEVLAPAIAGAQDTTGPVDRYQEARMDMLEAIRDSTADTFGYTGRRRLAETVMAAMAAAPRHEFVVPGMMSRAYLNTALPITHGQTISQPFIVALMTDFLDPQPDHVVLEVGTGSGYQAAVLSGLVKHIYSIEIIPGLTRSAQQVLTRLGYENITLKTADGYLGWPEHAPFDGIVVTAAADHIPPPLIEQLKPGGNLIIPVESPGGFQELIHVTKDENGSTRQRSVLPVRFVPLTGDHQD